MTDRIDLPIRQMPANFGPLKGANANARGDTGKPFANRFTESSSARAFDQIVRGILSALKDTETRTHQ